MEILSRNNTEPALRQPMQAGVHRMCLFFPAVGPSSTQGVRTGMLGRTKGHVAWLLPAGSGVS